MNKILSLIVVVFLSGCTHQYNQNIQHIPEKVLALEEVGVNNEDYAKRFDDGWATGGFEREDLISAALVETSMYFNISHDDQTQTKLVFYIDPEIPQQHHEWIKNLAERSFLTIPTKVPGELNIIVGLTSEFMTKTTEAYDLKIPMVSNEVVCDYDYGACTSDDTVWIGWGNQPLESLDTNIGAHRMMTHKVFHVIQDRMDPHTGGEIPPRTQENFRPVWFVEGSADFYAYSINHHFGQADYLVGSTKIEYKSLRDMEEWSGNAKEPYVWGQIATEYLVAHRGFDSFLEIYFNLNKGENFETAFYNAMGISLEDFYKTFDIWASSKYNN